MEVEQVETPNKMYKFVKKISSGKKSKVFECENLETGRRVAIKLAKEFSELISQNTIDLVLAGVVNSFVVEFIDIVPVNMIDLNALNALPEKSLKKLNLGGDAIVMEFANGPSK